MPVRVPTTINRLPELQAALGHGHPRSLQARQHERYGPVPEPRTHPCQSSRFIRYSRSRQSPLVSEKRVSKPRHCLLDQTLEIGRLIMLASAPSTATQTVVLWASYTRLTLRVTLRDHPKGDRGVE